MRPRTRFLFLAVVASAALVVLFTRSWRIDQTYSIDFQTYWLAGSRVAGGEANALYRPGGGPSEGIPLHLSANEFKNIPLVSVAFVPFARTDYLTAKRIFWWLALGALLAASWLVPRRPREWTACLALLAVMDPAHVSLRHGQTTPFVLAALAAYLAASRSRHDAAAGAFLGLACVVKFPPLAILAAEAVAGRRRLALSAGLTVALCVAVSVAWFGVPLHVQYLHGLSEHAGTVVTGHNNQSLLAVATRFLEPSPALDWSPRPAPLAARVLSLAVASVMALVLVAATRRSGGGAAGARYTAAVSLGLVAFPIAWDHYFLLLGPGIFLLAGEMADRGLLGRARWSAPLALGALAVTAPTPHRLIEAADRMGRLAAPGLAVECAGALILFGVSAALLLRTGDR